MAVAPNALFEPFDENKKRLFALFQGSDAWHEASGVGRWHHFAAASSGVGASYTVANFAR